VLQHEQVHRYGGSAGTTFKNHVESREIWITSFALAHDASRI